MEPEYHNNDALPYVAYDEYLLANENGQTIHQDYGIPITEFRDMVPMLVNPEDQWADGYLVLPGEKDELGWKIASDPCKTIIQSTFAAFRDNEKRNVCFGEFNETNLTVSRSGRVKFRNVTLLIDLDPPTFYQHLRGNYRSALRIITDLFPAKLLTGGGQDANIPVREIPEDIRHLLDLVNNDFEARLVFPIHGSLAPMVLYPVVFGRLYEYIRFVLPMEDFHDILRSLPYVDDWVDKIKSNSLLERTYNYNKGSYDVPEPKPPKPGKAAPTCMFRDQKKVLNDLGLTPYSGSWN